ncbi:hypothetical protein D3C81_533370 [compost metagenome]
MGIDLVQVHEQRGLILADQGKGYEHRIIGNVATAQVEQPGNVVQGGDEMPVGTAGAQRLAQVGQFLRAADRGLGRQMLIHRVVR